MIAAQAVQGTEPVSIWFLLPFFAAGGFCLCLGLTFVRDYRGLSSQIAARARDQVAQRVINKIMGWIFVVGGVVFLYGATTATVGLITR
ncbi:hypothetical protein [Streptomyces spinosirectus]